MKFSPLAVTIPAAIVGALVGVGTLASNYHDYAFVTWGGLIKWSQTTITEPLDKLQLGQIRLTIQSLDSQVLTVRSKLIMVNMRLATAPDDLLLHQLYDEATLELAGLQFQITEAQCDLRQAQGLKCNGR